MIQFQQEGDTWYEEDGTSVPLNRVTDFEKFCEKKAGVVFKRGLALHEKMQDFKAYLADLCDKAYHKFREENKSDDDDSPTKTFTWHNFNRSIKIQMEIKNRYVFDDNKVSLCQEKFNDFIDSIEGNEEVEMLKGIIHDAFQKRNGKFDATRLDSLFRHKDKIENKNFHEALELLKDARHHLPQNTYYRIFRKVPVYEGDVPVDNKYEYELIDLQFSSVNILKSQENGERIEQ